VMSVRGDWDSWIEGLRGDWSPLSFKIFRMFVLFRAGDGLGWDEWATRRSLDGSLGGDEVWVLVTMAVHRGLIWENVLLESALDSDMSRLTWGSIEAEEKLGKSSWSSDWRFAYDLVSTVQNQPIRSIPALHTKLGSIYTFKNECLFKKPEGSEESVVKSRDCNSPIPVIRNTSR
jgi:hypothetical protein